MSEEVNLREIGIYFLSKVFLIAIITLSVVLISGLYCFFRKPIYESSASIILTGFSDEKESSKINTNDLNINQKLIATYQEITKSRKVLTQVIQDLDLVYDVNTFAEQVRVTGKKDTEIIVIYVRNTDAELAYKITEKIAEVFSKEVKSIYNVSNVSLLDAPIISNHSSNMSTSKVLVMALMGGFLLSLIVVFIIYYFDNTIKNANQVEDKIGVPVLGSIPDFNKKKRIGGRRK
mgnify:CR=1 FL=1